MPTCLGTGVVPKKSQFATILAVCGVVAVTEPAVRAAVPDLPPVDPAAQPALERFRDWPPDALTARAYWEPWSPGSFIKAALFGRPVLFVMAPRWNLSSRRMMDEVLSDDRVLRVVNEMFVPVLVNVDRRPDLRERYQTGAWPVIAFLLPTGNPILSRANEARVQQPITVGAVDVDAMVFLLEEGREYYDKWTRPLTDVGEGWRRREKPEPPVQREITAEASDDFADWLMANADRQQGGFGLSPKFPIPGLYAYGAMLAARGRDDLAEHGRLTLERLIESPLYDRRDGGFHRLAREGDWSGLEYEKLLEPNVRLLGDLLVAARQAETPAIRRAIRGTADFIGNVLAREQGGFFIGQWADPESEDGGGYWRGEHDDPPPVERLVLAGPTAAAGEALLRAGVWLNDPATSSVGLAALRFVIRESFRAGRGVDHVSWPAPAELRLLSPQAEAALALVEGYQLTGEADLLEASRAVVDFALDNLRVAGTGMLVDRLPNPADIGLLRNPRFPLVPNVRLARAMLRLSRLTGDERYFEGAIAILGSLTPELSSFRPWPAEAGLAVEEALAPPLEIVIEGPAGSTAVPAFARAAAGLSWPWTVVSYRESERVGASLERNGQTARALTAEQLAERARALTAGDGGGGR